MDAIDDQGGIIAGIAAGRVQAAVNLQAYEREKDLIRGDVKKVGVNVHCEDEEEDRDIEFHPYRAEEANKQVERLAALRARRDEAQVHAALARLGEAARADRNVMPEALEAVEAYATVGEVCNVLKEVFGTYQEPVRF
jgi:methylmalonyl-CoA mutase N-terminal domain/subunit